MSLLRFLILGLLIDQSITVIIEVECDQVKLNYNYGGSYCTISGLDQTNETVEYDFVVRKSQYNNPYSVSYQTNFPIFKIVDFQSSKLLMIPRPLFQKFEHLENLKMEGCGIEDLPRFTFEHAKRLIILNLSRNNLTKLEKNTFTGTKVLATIDLSANKIAEIDEKAFVDVPTVKTLILSSNKIVKLDLKTFEHVKNLATIRLDNNLLESTSSDIFFSNQQIQEIDLNGNRLKTLDLVLFDNMPNILSLVDVSYNLLVNFSIRCQTFSYRYDFPNNLYVNLTNNFIMDLDISLNFSVTHLYIGNNNISDLSKITQLSSLVELDLSFNRIGALDVSTFANLSRLKYLNLESTGISNIDYGTFSHQSRLITLDISYNQLQKIELPMFASLSELQSIYIDGNNLTSLDYIALIETFPKLGIIGMQDNQFNCTELSKAISELNRRNIRIDIVEDAMVTEKSNVKGVGCVKASNEQISWTKPVHHINHVESSEAHNEQLTNKMNELVDVVKSMNETVQENLKLKQNLEDLKNRLIELTASFYEAKSGMISNQLAAAINSSTNMDSKDIKNMIEIMNNMTLDRQNLALEKLRHQLVEISFDVKKNSDRIETNTLTSKNEAHIQTASSEAGMDITTKLMVMAIFLMLVGFMIFKLVVYVKCQTRFRHNFRTRSQNTLQSHFEHPM